MSNPVPGNPRSGIPGVSWNNQFQKWHVRLVVNGKRGSYGLYTDLDEAAAVAERARAGEVAPNAAPGAYDELTTASADRHQDARRRPLTDAERERAWTAARGGERKTKVGYRTMPTEIGGE